MKNLSEYAEKAIKEDERKKAGKGKVDKVLLLIFSASILIQISAFFVTALVFDSDTSFLLLIYFKYIAFAVPPIGISLLTSILTVRLYIKKSLFQYSNGDIFKNCLISWLIMTFIGLVGILVALFISSGGDMALFFVLSLFASIAPPLFCGIAAGGLALGTTVYMGIISKK